MLKPSGVVQVSEFSSRGGPLEQGAVGVSIAFDVLLAALTHEKEVSCHMLPWIHYLPLATFLHHTLPWAVLSASIHLLSSLAPLPEYIAFIEFLFFRLIQIG